MCQFCAACVCYCVHGRGSSDVRVPPLCAVCPSLFSSSSFLSSTQIADESHLLKVLLPFPPHTVYVSPTFVVIKLFIS